eukprot:scaffold2448_cov250-Pinguiococcus_pyrenoidosus.AAC.4
MRIARVVPSWLRVQPVGGDSSARRKTHPSRATRGFAIAGKKTLEDLTGYDAAEAHATRGPAHCASK